MTLIGVSLLCGAVGMGLGARYQRPGAGFLWGALVGPIGWLVILAAGQGGKDDAS